MEHDQLAAKVETLEATIKQQQKQMSDLTGAVQNLARALFLITTPDSTEVDLSKAYDYYLSAADFLFPKPLEK